MNPLFYWGINKTTRQYLTIKRFWNGVGKSFIAGNWETDLGVHIVNLDKI